MRVTKEKIYRIQKMILISLSLSFGSRSFHRRLSLVSSPLRISRDDVCKRDKRDLSLSDRVSSERESCAFPSGEIHS